MPKWIFQKTSTDQQGEGLGVVEIFSVAFLAQSAQQKYKRVYNTLDI